MRLMGNVIPLVCRAIAPCDRDGIPSGADTVATDQFETHVVVFAWFGLTMSVPYGAVVGRKVDPTNFRRFAPGDLGASLV